MDQETEKRIATLVMELESIIPVENARVRIDVYGGDMDESYLRGNQAGLLWMGTQIIKSGIACYRDPSSKYIPRTVEADIRDLFHDESDIYIDWIERTDNLASLTHADTYSRKMVIWECLGLIGGIILLLLLFLLFYGISK